MTALLVGTLLALGALAFVLYPLFADAPAPRSVLAPSRAATESADADVAVAALREIEFDRATGKLADGDYESLKRRYTELALVAMRRADAAQATAVVSVDDEVEAMVRAARTALVTCPACGPRPEPDAVFCSNCGAALGVREVVEAAT